MPVSLVTGVSKGIGRAIADRLAAQGHHVVGLARSAPAPGFKGTFCEVDLTDREATRRALADIAAAHDLDNVVHNAAAIKIERIEAMTLEQVDAMLALNLHAGVLCVQAALPAMTRKRRGRIVMVGSRAALGKIGRGGYAATKAGLTGFVRTWALELAQHNITVNCVAPGPTETEMFRAGNPPDAPATKAIMAQIPLGRMGKPEETAAAVAYFLSDDAGFTTGQVLYVCGGLTVGLYPG